MNVLVACEYSGRVRDAFRKLGHDAWSCDIIDSEPPSEYHIKADVLSVLDCGWDLIIAHPPCTYLTVSNNRAMVYGCRKYTAAEGKELRRKGIEFFMQFTSVDCPRVCIENPIGIMSTLYRKPDQVVQPWMFGHGETKATCFWLKGLPKLKPTNVVDGRQQRLANLPPSEDRGKLRSVTYQGIADAMAAQWGNL